MGINQKIQKNVLIISSVRRVDRSAMYAQGMAVNPEIRRKIVTMSAIQASEGTLKVDTRMPVIGGMSPLAAATTIPRMKSIP